MTFPLVDIYTRELLSKGMFQFHNTSIQSQIEHLTDFFRANEKVWYVIENAHKLKLPNWYIGAGCLVQTIWNIQSGFAPEQSIKDIDLIYFDNSDFSKEKERQEENRVRDFFNDVSIEIDVKNQARVHLWYEQKFGYSISPYMSSEAAINTWPTTATSIAVRLQPGETMKVYAPYGLNDVYGLIARANKTQITKDIYETKTDRWKKCWPRLTVIPWEKG